MHALARAIALFTEQRLPGNGSPRSSYNFGIIEGGTSINSIPSQARTKVDIRSESAAKIEEISGLLTSCVEKALESENDRATGGKVNAKIKEIGSRPGGPASRTTPPFCNSSAPWTPIWGFVRIWIAPPPMPTFRSPWDCRPFPSAPEARAAARTRLRSGSIRKAVNSA